MTLDVAVLEGVRFAVGLTFLVSSLAKIRDPRAFAEGVRDYRLLPQVTAAPVAGAVIMLEALVAVALLAGAQVRLAGLAGVALSVSFAVAIGLNLARKRELPCHCFGAGRDERISRRSLARVALLLFGALLLTVRWGQAGAEGLGAVAGAPIAAELVKATLGLGFLILVRWLLVAPELRALLTRRELAPATAGGAPIAEVGEEV